MAGEASERLCVIPDRRPPARMESRDERVTVRLTPSQRDMFARAALIEGEELSRYLRRCALMGHTMRQARATVEATGG